MMKKFVNKIYDNFFYEDFSINIIIDTNYDNSNITTDISICHDIVVRDTSFVNDLSKSDLIIYTPEIEDKQQTII